MIFLEQIVNLVSSSLNVDYQRVIKPTKRSDKKTLDAKRLCMYFGRINTEHTNNEILQFLGYSKNPAELSHGVKWVKRKIKLNRDVEFCAAYKQVAQALGNLPVVL